MIFLNVLYTHRDTPPVFIVRACTHNVRRLQVSLSESASGTGLVAPYGEDSDADDDDAGLDENKLVDYSKLACLLCKRQFGSKDILQKHQQMSDLHKVDTFLDALI